MSEKLNPIILSFDDGRKYTLEFTRESVVYAERMGFNHDEVSSKMMMRVPELFHYAFRAHHPQLKKAQTDKILFEDLGGLTDEITERLVDLYLEPFTTLINEDGTPKNPSLTVQL